MRLLLTGGAGFIGQHVAAHLTAGGHDVVALDALLPQVHADPQAAIDRFPGPVIVGDVRDASAVGGAIRGCAAVIHLAAETGVAQSMLAPKRYLSVNVEGTACVAEQAVAAGSRLILASSRSVYGEGAWECPDHGRSLASPCCHQAVPSPSRETDPARPVSVYGLSKAMAEDSLARFRSDDLERVVVRPQNVVGPGQSPYNPHAGLLAAFAARLRAGLPPRVFDRGDQTRDFIDVRDVAGALAEIATGRVATPSLGSPSVNLGSGARTTLLELAMIACAAAGTPVIPELVDVSRPGDIRHACADTARARELGVPVPAVPLATSVADFMADAWSQAPADPGAWAVQDPVRTASDEAPTPGPRDDPVSDRGGG